MALAARHLFMRDQHYLVRDDKILMIDQTTGRLAPGRVWSRGLHQLIEVKEGCTAHRRSGNHRADHLSAFLSALSAPGRHERNAAAKRAPNCASVYGLSIERVPLRKPSRRVYLAQRVYVTRDEKWQAVVERVERAERGGRPVLIGTDSVADSDRLGRLAARAT